MLRTIGKQFGKSVETVLEEKEGYVGVGRGDMIEVFETLHNYYDTGASLKLNFSPVSNSRGNKFKSRKDVRRYDIRKYSTCSRIVKI